MPATLTQDPERDALRAALARLGPWDVLKLESPEPRAYEVYADASGSAHVYPDTATMKADQADDDEIQKLPEGYRAAFYNWTWSRAGMREANALIRKLNRQGIETKPVLTYDDEDAEDWV